MNKIFDSKTVLQIFGLPITRLAEACHIAGSQIDNEQGEPRTL